MATMIKDEQEYWAVVELMGYVRMAGKVSEVERYGAKCVRIDIPDGAGFKTQFFGGASLYRETPCTEEVGRAIAARCMPAPINAWDMPQRPALVAPPCTFCGGDMHDGEAHGSGVYDLSSLTGDDDEDLGNNGVDDDSGGRPF